MHWCTVATQDGKELTSLVDLRHWYSLLPVLLHGCETWTVNGDLERHLDAIAGSCGIAGMTVSSQQPLYVTEFSPVTSKACEQLQLKYTSWKLILLLGLSLYKSTKSGRDQGDGHTTCGGWGKLMPLWRGLGWQKNAERLPRGRIWEWRQSEWLKQYAPRHFLHINKLMHITSLCSVASLACSCTKERCKVWTLEASLVYRGIHQASIPFSIQTDKGDREEQLSNYVFLFIQAVTFTLPSHLVTNRHTFIL